MTTTDLLPLALETMAALAEHYNPAMQQVRDDVGLLPPDWGPVFTALGADPQPVTSAYLVEQAPYISLAAAEDRLAGAASRGFLEPAPGRAYRLSDRGRQMVRRSLDAAWERMAALEPIPQADLRRLAELLRRLVEASAAAPEPLDKRHLAASRTVDPGQDAPVVALIDQYLTDLVMFRDDVHPAAWRAYDVDGPAWEIFTMIWNGEATTAEALAQRLEGRRHTPDALAQALRGLSARGWIAEDGGAYRATEQGSRLREEAERETDRLFYAPWASLSEPETDELRGLLTRLRDESHAVSAHSSG
ncbi:MAG: hypothetical protein IPO81_30005 [Kouleothrix sp.]|nr:hypothetical protein [Kouleothrix sp.]